MTNTDENWDSGDSTSGRPFEANSLLLFVRDADSLNMYVNVVESIDCSVHVNIVFA